MDTWLWSRALWLQWWLDLLALAAPYTTRRVVRGREVTLLPGQLVASVRYLSKRWAYENEHHVTVCPSYKRVIAFLRALEDDGLIIREYRPTYAPKRKSATKCSKAQNPTESAETGAETVAETLITIVNYPQYQAVRCNTQWTAETGVGTTAETKIYIEEEEEETRAREFLGSESTKPPAEPPTIEQVRQAAQRLGLEQEAADDFFAVNEAGGWQINGIPIANWALALANWAPREKPKKRPAPQQPDNTSNHYEHASQPNNRVHRSGYPTARQRERLVRDEEFARLAARLSSEQGDIPKVGER